MGTTPSGSFRGSVPFPCESHDLAGVVRAEVGGRVLPAVVAGLDADESRGHIARPEDNAAAELAEVVLRGLGVAGGRDAVDGHNVPAAASGRGESAASVARSLDLIEGHNSQGDEGRVLLKTECYPSGAVRVVVKEVRSDLDPVAVAGKPNRCKRDPDEQERVESSVARTKASIRQRCMAFKCDRLLTLTYRENMQDRDRCYRDTVRFIAKAREARLIPQYVAVPELQKRGAWHVHIAIRGYMPVLALRRMWREVVGQDNGNIDISYRHRGESNPWRIAGYLSKYIGKAVSQAKPGERTYWASQWAALAPVSRAILLAQGVGITQVSALIEAILVRWRADGELAAVERWSPRPRGNDSPSGPGVVVMWGA